MRETSMLGCRGSTSKHGFVLDAGKLSDLGYSGYSDRSMAILNSTATRTAKLIVGAWNNGPWPLATLNSRPGCQIACGTTIAYSIPVSWMVLDDRP